jgi:hypothetical protein
MHNPLAALPVWAYALALVVSAQGLQAPRFIPPRLKSAELPPLPAPTVAGGGEVLIEAIVDRRGAMTRPVVSRATPPYTQLVLDAISRWQFEPARDIDYKGLETTVEMPVTVIAIYRPPILLNAPSIGEPPKDLVKVSGDVAVATSTAAPLYPPNALDGGVVLYEIALDESGRVTETRDMASTGGFQSAARDALAQFRFRPGSYRARPVPATTYVIFGFRVPVGLVPPTYTPPPAPLPPSSGVSSFR